MGAPGSSSRVERQPQAAPGRRRALRRGRQLPLLRRRRRRELRELRELRERRLLPLLGQSLLRLRLRLRLGPLLLRLREWRAVMALPRLRKLSPWAHWRGLGAIMMQAMVRL